MAETVLRVEHVGMRFNLSKERVDLSLIHI